MLTTEVDTNVDIDISTVQKICKDLTSAIVDNKVGISEKSLEKMLKTRERLLQLDEERMKKEGYPYDEGQGNVLENIKEKGLDPNRLTYSESYVSVELLDALIATSELINKTDPMKVRKHEYQGSEYVDTATLANIEFLDFFVKIHKKFHFADTEIVSLCEVIFKDVGFDDELKRKALENFPGGVAAALKAYLKISAKLPGWEIEAPSLDHDKKHSVDLLARHADGRICFFDIKGKITQEGINIINITGKDKVKKAEEKIQKGSGTKEQKSSDYSSIYRLHEYVAEQRKKGIKAFAYFVTANSSF